MYRTHIESFFRNYAKTQAGKQNQKHMWNEIWKTLSQTKKRIAIGRSCQESIKLIYLSEYRYIHWNIKSMHSLLSCGIVRVPSQKNKTFIDIFSHAQYVQT